MLELDVLQKSDCSFFNGLVVQILQIIQHYHYVPLCLCTKYRPLKLRKAVPHVGICTFLLNSKMYGKAFLNLQPALLLWPRECGHCDVSCAFNVTWKGRFKLGLAHHLKMISYIRIVLGIGKQLEEIGKIVLFIVYVCDCKNETKEDAMLRKKIDVFYIL